MPLILHILFCTGIKAPDSIRNDEIVRSEAEGKKGEWDHLWNPLEFHALDGLIVAVGDIGGILAELPGGGVGDGIVVSLCHNVHVGVPADISPQGGHVHLTQTIYVLWGWLWLGVFSCSSEMRDIGGALSLASLLSSLFAPSPCNNLVDNISRLGQVKGHGRKLSAGPTLQEHHLQASSYALSMTTTCTICCATKDSEESSVCMIHMGCLPFVQVAIQTFQFPHCWKSSASELVVAVTKDWH